MKDRYDYVHRTVKEIGTFRFGPGSPIKSTFAVLVPIEMDNATFLLRLGVIDKEVPALMSKSVVKGFRGVVDMDKMRLEFR